MKEKTLLILGQIGGYGAGLISWLTAAKEVLGWIGVTCGAILSVWAVVDRIRRGLRDHWSPERDD